MISKVTEKNRDLISARMAEINKALQAANSDIRISNLAEYYANIVEISKLATDFGPSGHKAPYRFLLMPLDEPLFEIDANKRTISVPQVFSKNGIGVRGDHKAEILYFKIDKYFDYKDLFQVDSIIINWQFRPANASRNAEFPINPSIALAPDDSYEDGHIVFGWVITNEMTPSKGTLNFSVSFVMKTGDQYNYLLSTQVASVNVNDTLLLEDPSVLDSLKGPIFERLQNSRYTAENLTPLVDPSFRTGERVEEDGEVIFRGLEPVANFVIDSNGDESPSLKLSAVGINTDDGTIEYRWSWSTYNPEDSDGDIDPRPTTYVETKDTAPVKDIKYYLINNGTPELLEGEALTDAFASPTAVIYEVGTEFTAEYAGSYIVSMQSSKTVRQQDVDPITIKSGNIESRVCSIPYAAVPAVELSVAGLTPESGHYEVYDAAQAEGFTFVEGDSTPTIQANISIDESKIYDAASGEGVRGVSANSEIGAIALKLTKAEGDSGKPQANEFADMIFKVQDEKDEISYTLTRDGGTFPVNSASANGEGTYKVYAVNRRNHTYSVSDASNTLKVSAIAPYLSGIKVTAVDLPNDAADLILIRENQKVGEAKLDVGSSVISHALELVVEDTFENLADAVSLEATLYEISDSAYEADGTIARLIDDPNASDMQYEGTPSSYAMVVDANDSQKFAATISGDPGYYIAEVVAKYNGTKRASVTEPFRIV